MESTKVIKLKNLPTRPPLVSTVVAVLALDFWNAPQWVWAVVITLMVLLWIGVIIAFSKQTQVDIFEESGKDKVNKQRS